MADTTFISKVTKIATAWLQDVNDLMYRKGGSKATPINADEISLWDSVSGVWMRLTWANLRTTLGSTFAALAGLSTQDFSAKKLTLGAGALIESEGAAVTAASSTNIWTGDGNTVHVTGNTGITDFATAPQAGAWMKVIFDGTPLLTQSANLNLNAGGANIQIAAGDFALVYADTTTQMDVFVTKKDGTAIVRNEIGYGQTWQNVTGSRVANGTTYTNSTAKPIMVNVTVNAPTNTTGGVYLTINSVNVAHYYDVNFNQSEIYTISAIVPPSTDYSATIEGTATLNTWAELR